MCENDPLRAGTNDLDAVPQGDWLDRSQLSSLHGPVQRIQQHCHHRHNAQQLCQSHLSLAHFKHAASLTYTGLRWISSGEVVQQVRRWGHELQLQH